MTLLLSVAFSSVLGAVECDPDDPGKCAAQLKKGQPAPFTGQLLTPKLAIDLGLDAEYSKRSVELELKYAKRELQLDLDLERALRENDRQTHRLEMKAMALDRDRWKEAADTPFYREPVFVAVVTAAVVTSVFIGASQVYR